MVDIKPLPVDKLKWNCVPESLPFETTDQLEDLEQVLGQDRAIEAIRFGTNMTHKGYNIFALGPDGLDKHEVVLSFLKDRAHDEPIPSDWCYVYNFQDPRRPRALELPPRRGVEFRQDMSRLAEDIPFVLKNAFESEEYQTRSNMIQQEIKDAQDEALSTVDEEAHKRNTALKVTPLGFTFVPVKDGKTVSPEEFRTLPEDEKREIEKNLEYLREKLEEVLEFMPDWLTESRDKMRKLNEETAGYAVGHPVEELKKKYADLPAVVEYLSAVQDDIIQNVHQIVHGAEEDAIRGPGPQGPQPRSFALEPGRYMVNLIVDNSEAKHAPVVHEDEPTYDKLLGRVEYRSEMGALITDFRLIRAGTLHEANGGYLVVDILKLLVHTYAYDALKRALKAEEIKIESLGQALGFINTVSLEPEPIPLKTKVVILGTRVLYYLLSSLDPEFTDLFKVAADFDEQMERSEESLELYSRMLASRIRQEELQPFSKEAIAKILERVVRYSGDSEKLSTRLRYVGDLLRESNYHARQDKKDLVEAPHVEQAVKAREHRQSRMRERLLEETEHGTILIDTAGRQVGQINGLSVIDLGSYAFGRPTRITARIRLGKGEVVDIEREVKLGGPIHSKGVLILSGFLGAQYLPDQPLSLSASLVFEQSYGGIEGDSASMAELCALLSAIADVPIAQGLAITGSVNQQGQAQAIGGVNEKIEGFFDLCALRGLDGTQGVIIPASNVRHLMLDQRVLDAVEDKKFQIYAINHVDQAIELLTGREAGKKDEKGQFPEGTFNHRVEEHLKKYTRRWLNFSRQGGSENR
ncbi:ATP-binding protein [Emcibacter sp.]|uniref:Lon protease family protein n=1 Tax=Emcibacter sp. TaxID=1979954 RepID=UPI002AA69769|nr:ATP-binding protein [Emcibacter sp.]